MSEKGIGGDAFETETEGEVAPITDRLCLKPLVLDKTPTIVTLELLRRYKWTIIHAAASQEEFVRTEFESNILIRYAIHTPFFSARVPSWALSLHA